jgi:hypothetical protein
MSEDWKKGRAEAAIKEGTDKIMKEAQEKAEHEMEMISESPTDEQMPSTAESFDGNVNEEIKPKYVDVCLGVGMNQLFPETTRIILEESDEENS